MSLLNAHDLPKTSLTLNNPPLSVGYYLIVIRRKGSNS